MATHHHLGYNFAAGAQASITTSAFAANAAVVVRTIYLYALDAGFTGSGYPHVDGDGLTYVGRRSFGTDRRFWILTGVGSPSAGALTLEFSTAMGDTLENPLFFVVESRPESGGDLSFVQLAGIEEAAPTLNLGNDYDAVLALSGVTAGNALLGFFWKLNVGTDPWTVSREGWSSIQEQRHYGGAVSDRTIVVGRADDDTTAEVEALAASNNSPWAGWVLELAESSGGGTTVNVGQAAETDTALGVAWTRSAPLGQAQEVDAAQALSHARSAALGTPTEVSMAVGVSWARSAALGLAQEASVALPVPHARARAIDQVAETDVALAVTALLHQVVPIGLAVEVDTAHPLFGITKRLELALAVETDAALVVSVNSSILQPVGLAIETDVALPVGHARARGIGLAVTADAALQLVAQRAVALGMAQEAGVGLPVAWTRATAVGLATESDLALQVTVQVDNAVFIGLATEVDTALGTTWARQRSIGLAEELDEALGLEWRRAAGVGLALEADVAFPLGSSSAVFLGRADELDVALATSWRRIRAVGLAETADIALPVGPRKAVAVAGASEGDIALPLTLTRAVLLGQAVAGGTALPLGWARSVGLGLALEADVALLVTPTGPATVPILYPFSLLAPIRAWNLTGLTPERARMNKDQAYEWNKDAKERFQMILERNLPGGVTLVGSIEIKLLERAKGVETDRTEDVQITGAVIVSGHTIRWFAEIPDPSAFTAGGQYLWSARAETSESQGATEGGERPLRLY